MSNRQTVSDLYEALGRGDVAFWFGRLSDDIEWDGWDDDNVAQSSGLAYMQPRHGVAGVEQFFKDVRATLQPLSMDVDAIIGDGPEIVARVTCVFRAKATGVEFTDEEMQWFVFDDDGKVARFRHYIDTAKHLAANAPAMGTPSGAST